MVNQACVWSTYLCHSGPVWQKFADFLELQKISQTFGERAFAKFRDKNAVFVNFCHKNVTFSNTQYPKIPDYSENISGRVRVLLKIIGSGRVSGTRLTLVARYFNNLQNHFFMSNTFVNQRKMTSEFSDLFFSITICFLAFAASRIPRTSP